MKMFMITLIFTLLTFSPSWAASNDKARNHDTFPIKVNINNTDFLATVYVPSETSIRAMLIISPTIDGVTLLEKTNAAYFSKRGYVVIVPELFDSELTKEKPNAEKLNADFYTPVVSTIHFINLVDQRLKLPENLPIFALGASQGGIVTLLISAYIPKVRASWFAVAGGDLPYIYAHSQVEQLVKFRANHMRHLGIKDKNEYESYLRLYLKNDPTISCKDIKIPFHQTISLKDFSVPTKTQELLVDECPPHDVTRYNLNHVNGAITTVKERKSIYEFFESFI